VRFALDEQRDELLHLVAWRSERTPVPVFTMVADAIVQAAT
jgi:hypothetical protein